MFYRTKVKDFIRLAPEHFSGDLKESVIKCIKKNYEGYISKDFGIVIDVEGIEDINEGVIIPGDGASYHETVFSMLVYKPEMQEVILGRMKDIAEFGGFVSIGPIEAMIHISQTMDDFVSFSKDKALSGKESKRVLKVGDVCRARIIAISYKDPTNPKFSLTMRQEGLGKLEWLNEEKESVKETKKESKKK